MTIFFRAGIAGSVILILAVGAVVVRRGNTRGGACNAAAAGPTPRAVGALAQ